MTSGPPRIRPGDRSRTAALLSWALYDWASSSFSAIVVTFVCAAYFTRQVAESEESGTAYWALATGLAGIVVALGGPLLGAVADNHGRRRPWIAGFTLMAVAATGLLWFVKPDAGHIGLAVLLVAAGTIASEYAVLFYNAMLPDLAPADRIGRWSGWGWGLGYAGGLLSLVAALFAFLRPEGAWLPLDRGAAEHVRAAFPFCAAWYLAFSLPLLVFVPDPPSGKTKLPRAFAAGWAQLIDSLRNARRHGGIVVFLVARMLYTDGLATLFAFGSVYAAGTFGMDEREVLLFGIALHVSAGAGAAAFGWIDDRIGSRRAIVLSLLGLIVSSALLLSVRSPEWFRGLGLVLGLFVGPAQSASRSYLARIAPADMRNQLFGLYALSGKATSFLGPMLVGWLTVSTGSQRIGMGTVPVLFVLGLIVLLRVPKEA